MKEELIRNFNEIYDLRSYQGKVFKEMMTEGRYNFELRSEFDNLTERIKGMYDKFEEELIATDDIDSTQFTICDPKRRIIEFRGQTSTSWIYRDYYGN